MARLAHFLRERANDVMVALMAAMFFAFIVQIGSRYVFNAPVDWTFEVILITWLWSVFWGAAFLLKDRDQVKFDVIYNHVSERAQRLFALISALFLAAGFLLSAPATWSFIEFKSIRSTDMLHVRFDVLFGVYMLFLGMTVIHYLWRAVRIVRGDALETLDGEREGEDKP
jgi:TRAP-type C4-dicarboxylate transport system permease small subunit